MSTIVMSHPPPRKPVPGRPPPAAAPFDMHPPKQPPAQLSQERMHSRTRTNSSAAIPFSNMTPPQLNPSPTYSMTSQQQQQQPQPQPQQQQQPYPGQSRRTLSNSTSSTSTSANSNQQRAPTSYGTATGVRRSTSSRSNSSVSPTSYVALMRKQKGTVWCDRAQHEDPRLLQAQRHAKMRAAAEIAGKHSYTTHARATTGGSGVVGGVRSKIRHHGAPKASAYNAAVLGGAGVPMRLSATEVDDGNDSDEDSKSHARNSSEARSLGSGGKRSYLNSGLNPTHNSNGSTPPNRSPVEDVPEEETPMQHRGSIQGDDYFNQQGGSGSSGEQEEQFGTANHLPYTRGKLTAEEQAEKAKKNAEDLQRRGSVDDRTMTMSGVRLFVANPDQDSD